MQKCCTICKKTKDIDEFPKDKKQKDGYSYRCLECNRIRNKKYKYPWTIKKKINKFKSRSKIKYGITEESFNQLLINQNNCCAICLNPFDDKRKPCIDHNHQTNKIRGLLCNNCNIGFGFFKENITILQNAIKYKEKEIS